MWSAKYSRINKAKLVETNVAKQNPAHVQSFRASVARPSAPASDRGKIKGSSNRRFFLKLGLFVGELANGCECVTVSLVTLKRIKTWRTECAPGTLCKQNLRARLSTRAYNPSRRQPPPAVRPHFKFAHIKSSAAAVKPKSLRASRCVERKKEGIRKRRILVKLMPERSLTLLKMRKFLSFQCLG